MLSSRHLLYLYARTMPPTLLAALLAHEALRVRALRVRGMRLCWLAECSFVRTWLRKYSFMSDHCLCCGLRLVMKPRRLRSLSVRRYWSLAVPCTSARRHNSVS